MIAPLVWPKLVTLLPLPLDSLQSNPSEAGLVS